MNDAPLQRGAAHYAGLIFAHKDTILHHWCELTELSDDEPGAQFIQNQFDATILALANWFLGEDPAGSSMSLHWAGIQPSRELADSATIAMSLLPEAVHRVFEGVTDIDQETLLVSTSRFSARVTSRILKPHSVVFDERQWEQITDEIESRYAAQRIRRIERLGVLIDIAHAVSTTQNLETLFEHVQQSIIRLSGSDYVEISLLDEKTSLLRCYLVYGDGRRRHDLEQTLIEHGLANEVLTSGKELAVSDYVTACQNRGIPPMPALASAPQRAWMGAPMRLGDQAVGVIAVSGPLTSFDHEDLELLDAIARQTAVALENRRLIVAQKRHVSQLSAVNHLARETAELRDVEALMQVAVERIHEFFGYGLVTVFRLDGNGKNLIMRARAPISIENEHQARTMSVDPGSVVGEVAASRRSLLIDDVQSSPLYMVTDSTRKTQSEMTVPIIYSGNLLGILDVQSEHAAAFDEHDLTTLETIADQIAIGLENSRLFADEAQRTRELSLMLDTTRAASSSLLLEEVLERLANGIASTAGTESCLIHLYDPEERYFRPAVLVNPDATAPAELFIEWNRILPVDGRADLQQVLDDPFPQWMCPYSSVDHSCDCQCSVFLIPLRTRQGTLGLAIVASQTESGNDVPYPIEKMRLLQGVADSAALAVENARLYARAHGLAIAEERGRLAQEIHDTLAQGLTAISLQLDLADSYLPEKADNAVRNVRRALELTRQNLDEARRSVLDLRAADVHQMSLPDAISRLLRRLGAENEMEFELVSDGLTNRLSARVEVGLYRILEEAVENARKHSHASCVRVTLQADGNTVTVLIEDDGEGFDPGEFTRSDDSNRGFGLLGIRERARLLGGSLTITSTPGAGTSLQVVVPYEARLRASAEPSLDQGAQP